MSRQPLIALDLELEQSKYNPQTPDSLLEESRIIQVGWCIFVPEENGQCKVLESYSEFINIEVPLSAFIKQLTAITDEEISNGHYFIDSVYEKLVGSMKQYGASRIIRQWGSGDQEAIQKELSEFCKWEFGHSGMNVKHLYQAYALANGMIASGGLSRSMGKLGLPWLSKHNGSGKHNAEVDAINTARFYCLLESKFNGN